MKTPFFTIEPYNRFFAGIRSIADYEIRPQNTATFMNSVDLTRVEALRSEAAAQGRPKPSYTAFVVKAVAQALREFPYANRRLWGFWWLPYFQTRLQRFNRSDITVAVERNIPGVEVALFSDLVRDADTLSLDAITERLSALAHADTESNEQWRQFSMLLTRFPHWLSTLIIRMPVFFPGLWMKYRGAAAMVSSPARYGVDAIAATWTSPLGFSFGVVESRAVVKDGKVVSCPTFTLTLNFDRRVMAGAQAARFFHRVVELLEGAGEAFAGGGPAPAEGPGYTIEPFNRYVSAHRKIVEDEMRPKYTVSFLHEVDLTGVEAVRAKILAAGGTRPSYTAFVAKAVARAMEEFPYANARVWGWPGVPLFRTRVQRFYQCDVAVAVERALPGVEVATFIDVIRDVGNTSLAAITESLHKLATGDASQIKQWREFSTLITRFPIWLSTRLIMLPLRFPSLWLKYRGGAVLISSPAKYGVDCITATWSWALGVSFGVVKERPFVKDNQVTSRRSFTLTLNFDRRFLAVAQAGRFFRRLVDVLESAETALTESTPALPKAPAAPAHVARPYTIEPNSRFVSAYRAMVDFEMEPQRTVIFIHSVDLTEIEAVRADTRRNGGMTPSYTAFIAKAAALALKEFPYANRRLWTRPWIPFRSPRLQQFHRRDVAVAFERSIPGIQVAASVDVVQNADELSLEKIMHYLETFRISDVTINERWRRFTHIVTRLPFVLSTLVLRMPVRFPSLWVAYRGGAIIINSPGEYGIDVLTGEWCWPLGVSFGTVALRPVVRNGEVVPCPTFTLTLTWDRRVMAGAQAARFFRRMMDALEHAQTELADDVSAREPASASKGAV
jgi:pyruvate/2-oxoglutarate dehydrogenase complex dihydrolipoamide acyltransferase (E2) component